MDAIKKKMQAMKVEKDNAMDRSDACEQAAKDAKVRYEGRRSTVWRTPTYGVKDSKMSVNSFSRTDRPF